MAYHPNIPTPTGVVQDELAQMRENFQHLDPLAQAVGELQTVSGLALVANELQTVSGLALVANELQTVSGLAPYVQAILYGRIVDHNLDVADPPTGWYVRWGSGLQLCARKLNKDFSTQFATQASYPAAFEMVFSGGYVIGDESIDVSDLEALASVVVRARAAAWHINNATTKAITLSVLLWAVGRWQ